MRAALWPPQRRRRRVWSALGGAAGLWRISGTGALVDVTGNGMDARLGATAGADATDPLFLAPVAGRPYLYLPGLAGNYASVPDAAALDVVGDLDVRMEVQLADWTPASNIEFISKWVSAGGNLSYKLGLLTTGELFLGVSVTGAAAVQIGSSVATGIADGARSWVRIARRNSDGRVQFFTSTDGVTWPQLGTDRSAIAASIFAGTAPVEIGTRELGTVGLNTGNFFRAQIFASIDGTAKVLDIDFTDLAAYDATRTSLVAVTGQTVTLNRAAAGRKTTIVDEPWLLSGTDDYAEVADNPLLDFAQAESFTLFWRGRVYPTSAGLVLIAKKAGGGTTVPGYIMYWAGVGTSGLISDGVTGITAIGPAPTPGVKTVVAMRRRAGVDLTMYTNGVAGAPVADTVAGSLANADALRFMRASGAGANYLDAVTSSGALFRRAMTGAEIIAAGAAL